MAIIELVAKIWLISILLAVAGAESPEQRRLSNKETLNYYHVYKLVFYTKR